MSHPYQQVQCPRCHAAAWALPNQAVPCQACGTPVPPLQQTAAPMPFAAPPPAAAAPGAPNAWSQAPAAAPMNNAGGPAHLQGNQGGIKIPGLPGKLGNINMGGKHVKAKVIGGVVLAAAAGVAGVVIKSKIKKKSGGGGDDAIGLSKLGIDPAHADPDVMISALTAPAKGWKKDAVFWSINVLGLRSDGTIDLDNGGIAQVSYASPSAASSHDKKTRDDSVKEYNITPNGARSDMLIGFEKAIDGFEGPPVPKCTVKQVAGILKQRGLADGKTVHLNFDPQFSSMVDAWSWHILGDDPKMDLWLSTEDCSVIKG